MSGSARLLLASAHRRMAWKNGLGETAKIAAFPPTAGMADFGWRVSMARVAADGPFSSFPGVDRTLSIVSGEGVRLVVDDRAAELGIASAPFSFPADAPTQAFLLAGPVVDLNVMTRRTEWTHRVRHIEPTQECLTLEGAVSLAVCTGGEVELSCDGAAFHLHVGDALLVPVDGGGKWKLRRRIGPARLIAIAIDPSARRAAGSR